MTWPSPARCWSSGMTSASRSKVGYCPPDRGSPGGDIGGGGFFGGDGGGGCGGAMVEVRASMETVRFNRLTWYRRWKLAQVMKKLPPSDVKCEVLGNIESRWQWRRDVTMIGSWHSLHIILNKAGLRYDPKTEPPTMGALQASEGEHDIGTGEQILSTLVSGMAMGQQVGCELIPVTGQGVVSRGWWEMAEAGVVPVG